MVRIGTFAAIVGIFAALWNIWAYSLVCRNVQCVVQQPAPTGAEGTLVLGVAIVLLISSLTSFVGPEILFYLLAALEFVIDVLEAVNYSEIAVGSFYVTILLATAGVALSLVAARRRTSVSEQSHPMNLPVFG